ncbi:Deoxyhypusine hydroxylase [Cyberlindnera fabianii]|uniref:Deoxyhypusine hydroxylase n=1 Tax=Cyberlindnera fabianii TaxID=36022 RepID=A0A1V2L6Q6_CYBFA|nr:Deoxyhypusine hydroxylase [Cyberlindnera fabianii]
MSVEQDVDNATLEQLRDILINKSGDVKLAVRFRALFNLKSIGSEFKEDPERANTAVKYIGECFRDDSELLKHEVAYVLGQTKNLAGAQILRDVLIDEQGQQCMVRHEAAEALGALNDVESLPLLEKYFKNDPLLEIRQTCELAIERIKWETSEKANTEKLQESAYSSIDPAPPLALDQDYKIEKLTKILNDQSTPLFERYRAMFRLRDIGSDEACLALATGFDDPSALFKHEIAYVFGQLSNPVTVPSLVKVLKNETEAPMVRHEAAEALGSIATDDVLPILQDFAKDSDEVVRDSAIVALDMYEYENSNELEYATAA